ncbi:MAG TPA: glycosyltransferase family 4 protein [Chloroflexia bacterium]|nr:glycosyltransferase family 4 protein [Chloroflexia bacterium]
MRVAYVCADPGVPIYGRKGCSVHAQEVIRALCKRGLEVEVFASRVGGEPPDDLEEIVVHQLPPMTKDPLVGRERAALLKNGDLYAALDLEGPFDMVYERYSLWSFMAMQYARDKEVPGILEVNAPLIEEQAEHRGLVDRALAEWVAEKAFRNASALLAVSRQVADYLVRCFPGIGGRVHIVPNGVDPSRFGMNSKGEMHDNFTVGFVGTLKPWHGLPILVEAFAQLHLRDDSARLLIVGDGPQREGIEDALAEQGLLSAADFAGAVDPAEIPGLLARMDVAVAPYPDLAEFYFSPLKVYEYMAAALPVVASRIGQLKGLIEDGVNGLLCPPGDADALTEALDTLRRDPALRARLGRAARETILRGHTWDAVADRILELAAGAPSEDKVLEGV